MTVVVADFGAGNLHSVARAFEKLGVDVRLAATAQDIVEAERLVLPGVGAFAACVGALRQRGLDEAVIRFAKSGKPLLGICVGMQMLFEGSDEFGRSDGLSLLSGWVRAMPTENQDAPPRKVPHVGWSELHSRGALPDWSGTVLAGLEDSSSAYFLHSFIAQPDSPRDEIACCEYDGLTFTAAVARDNLSGCQFHPEKSGPVGLAILSNFLKLP